MRCKLVASILFMGACTTASPDEGGVVQEVADPDPGFAIPSASFSGAIVDPLWVHKVAYCGSSPQTACTAAPSAQVHWGDPALTANNPNGYQSGLGFEPAAAADLDYGVDFALGTLTHFNWPTWSGTWASGVTLDITVVINGSTNTPILTAPISIPLTMNETPNTTTLTGCPTFQLSTTPCDDQVTFGTSTFTLGQATTWTDYTLNIIGFVAPAAPTTTVSGLISTEGGNSSAVLMAELTEECRDLDHDEICDEFDWCVGDETVCPPDPCPCDADWKNHGDYVTCVVNETRDRVNAGTLTHQERGELISAAGGNDCGKQ